MDVAAGRLGAGRFEVHGTLGTGGAGVVYRAFDRQLGREVALKLLRRASGRDLYRFKREFRTLADIAHPNLVALHELHAAPGGDEWYFTMELVEGVSFIDWVRPPRGPGGPSRTRADIAAARLAESNLRGALVQLVDALVALHEAGKLHRDLKPSNVLVTREGRVALLDFGLVAQIAEGNPERLAVGTPVYMSPEQAADQPLSEASDWYSLGAMLYEALVGRRPFEGESEEVMSRKQVEVPLEPAHVARGVPADLAKLAMQLLEARPAARPTGLSILARLGAAPSPKTRDIARTALPATFVGRGRELEELRRALVDARRRGVAVMVRGKSGIGKSTLVRRFLRSMQSQIVVLEGRCFEREQVPFKMLDGVVDTLTQALLALPAGEVEAIAPAFLPSLTRLFPVMKRVKHFAELAAAGELPADPAELRRRGFTALRALIGKLAKHKPVAIFVDDAHWGDADSVGFVAELAHGGDPGLLVIVAHRPEDYLGVAAKLRAGPAAGPSKRGDVRELEIGALPDDDAAQLVAQLARDSARASDVVRAAGGNPLVLGELARAPDPVAAGARIEDIVKARAARLSPDVQAMLAVSAIAARPISVEIAARAAGVEGGHEEAGVLASERLATVRRVEGQAILAPAHDHVRAAIVASLDIESRAMWHEALARAFEDGAGEQPLDPQAVVEHWLAAGHPANAAAHAVPAAARAEEALAFRRAAELYEIALTYGPWDAAGQRDLLRKQAHALACVGQLDEAAKLYGDAAQLLPDDDSIDCERLRIEALLRRGRLDEALPAADRLLGPLGVRSPFGKASKTRLATQWMQQKLRGLDFVERDASSCKPAELQRIDVLYSIVSGLAFADPGLGRVLQAELMRLALEAGEPTRVALALAQEVCYAAAAGSRSWSAVEAVGARLVAIAARVGHPHVRGLADTAIGVAAYMGGRWREARARLEAGLATLHDHGAGVRWELDVGETHWLATLDYLGEWREHYRQSQVMLRDAVERGDVVAQLGARAGLTAWLVAGREADARAQLAAFAQSLPPGFHLPHVRAMQAACHVELYAGDAAAAARRLAAAWPELDKLGALRIQQLRVELQVLRARTLLADHSRPADERSKLARAIGDDVVKEGAPWAVALGLCVRAGALVLRGDRDGALTALAAAEDQLAYAGMIGWLHVAKLRRGTLEGGPGGTARAAGARDFLRDLGANDPDRVAALYIPWP